MGQALNEKTGSGCGENEHGDNKHDANGLEGGNNGQGQGNHETIMNHLYRHAQGSGQAGIEGSNEKKTVKNQDEGEVQQGHRQHDDEGARPKVNSPQNDGFLKGQKPDLAVQNTFGIQMDVRHPTTYYDNSNRKKSGEDDSYRGIGPDP